MLVLGEKYKFTKLDEENLIKRFQNIHEILYSQHSADEVIKQIDNILAKEKFSIIVLNTEKKVSKQIISYLTKLRYKDKFKNIQIITIENFLEKYLYKCYIPEDGSDLDYLAEIKGYTKFQYLQKRFIDLFGIFWLAIFSFYVYQKSKWKIKKESPDGDVYFKQKRVGYKNREFTCVKFRSMHTKTDFFNHYTQKDDPRIFNWGEYMRKRRYDELPQMWNILKGEMHLIGPRAEWNELVKKYEKKLPYYNYRHLVAPGITGWAQVNYPYGFNLEDTKQKLMYDFYYIKNWNLWLELKIVWKTAMVVLKKKGV